MFYVSLKNFVFLGWDGAMYVMRKIELGKSLRKILEKEKARVMLFLDRLFTPSAHTEFQFYLDVFYDLLKDFYSKPTTTESKVLFLII